MSDIIECPANGCDYRGNSHAVRGHWGGQQDEAHSGKMSLPNNKPDSKPEAAESDETDGSDLTPTEASFNTDGRDNDTDRELTLPCGHESLTESEAVARHFYATCETCGKRFEIDLDKNG